MKKTFSYTVIIAIIAILTISWGSTGHRKISTDSSLSFNQKMSDFHLWTSFLAEHASDADYRKQEDPNEAPKHYIDIDSYYSFLLLGRIPQTLDSVVNLYGSSFVYDNGILPYATIANVELLQQYFEQHDMENAKVIAADLGHYVGDGHMPLHITKNYNGEETGNDGIHSRYETSMINTFSNQINYTGDSITVIPDITSYVFDYIYKNYIYVDSVILADNYAKNLAGNTDSYAYKQALWEKTQSFTIPLFKRASHSLTELIYTAWVNAGSPSLTASDIEEFETRHGSYLGQAYPCPFVDNTKFRYSIAENEIVKISASDLTGKIISVLVNEPKAKGSYEFTWVTASLPAGIYLLKLEAGNSIRYRKVIRLN